MLLIPATALPRKMATGTTSYINGSLARGPRCQCGYDRMLELTSKTSLNPGRVFWKCPKSETEHGCGLLMWKDEVMEDDIAGLHHRNEQEPTLIQSANEHLRQDLQRSCSDVKEALADVNKSISDMAKELRQLKEMAVALHSLKEMDARVCQLNLFYFAISLCILLLAFIFKS